MNDERSSRAPQLEGYGDYAGLDGVRGWALDPARPAARVAVDVWCDGVLLDTVEASEPREDLRRQGGDGRHGFSYALPASVRRDRPHFLEICFRGTRHQLHNSPRGVGDFGVRVARSELYAAPRRGEPIESCYFYHTMDLPGVGTVHGEWDLRGRADEYLGGVDFAGKRVLEVGKASGFLTLHMESRGAEVVAYDLSEFEAWDIVPYASLDVPALIDLTRVHIWRNNNAFWFTQQALGGRAQLVLGSVYEIPAAIGPVDIAVLGAVLLHVRDPFLALQNALRLVRETAVVVEAVPPADGPDAAAAYFLPDAKSREPRTTWWGLPPQLMQRFLEVLGFEVASVTYHEHAHSAGKSRLYTMVSRRRP